MKKSTVHRIWAAVLFISAIMTAGCSLLLLANTRKENDKNTYYRQQLKGWELYKIPQGAELKVRTGAYKTYTGLFSGTARENPEVDSIDNILLIKSSSKKSELYRIPAKDIKTIHSKIERKRVFVPIAKVGLVEKGELLEVYKDKKKSPVKGKFMGLRPLKKDTSKMAITLKTGSSMFTSIKNIRVAEVDSVIIPGKKTTNAFLAFLGGLVVDAAIVVAVISDLPLVDFGNFCPYVYSFDGESYRRDAEIFSGADFPAAQRSDWDNLDHLKPDKDGMCRLKLTNELDETQYVDALQLMVVDHPKGTAVYPSFEGKLFTVSAPQQPESAITSDGADIRESLEAKDGDYWLSSPFDRNPDNPADLRDGAVLEFRRPSGSNSAVLVFNVMNTIWATEMQRQVLNLMGNELPVWYITLETSASERQKMHEAMVREGMLLVSIWNGKGWRSAGHVWEVGSAVAKDVALEINLSGIPGETLRVRLDCPPGTWIIDKVQADFSYATGAENAPTILPVKAVDEEGKDVIALLSEADNKYFIMPTTFRRATVEYKIPDSPARGLDRTYILQSNGYYTVHTKDQQKPQSDLFRQILNTPGAYNRYMLQQLNEAVKEIVQESVIK